MANEGTASVSFVEQVLAQCPVDVRVSYFVVIDHVSVDETQEELEKYASHEPRLKVVWSPENRCVVDAYVRGYQEALSAECDWILEIDAGFSHRPEDIPRFLKTMMSGQYVTVFGSRFMMGGSFSGPWRRFLTSYLGSKLSNWMLGTFFSDATSGFQLFRKDVLRAIVDHGLRSKGPFFQTEMKHFCRQMQYAELPIHYSNPSHAVGVSAIRESLIQLRRLMKEGKSQRQR